MTVKTLLGKKLGMTQIFQPDGTAIPCTAIEVGPCQVLQVRTPDKNGYSALQLGFDEKNEKSCSKPELGHFKKHKSKPTKVLRETRWDGQDKLAEGDRLTVELFENIPFVNITGKTKGRGFTGVVKRWNFHGGPATHGQTDRERAPGSLGRQGSVTRDVIKGKKMAGRYGNETVTIRNLRIVQLLKDKNVMLVKGAVPGPTGGYLVLSASRKKLPEAPAIKKRKVEVVKKK